MLETFGTPTQQALQVRAAAAWQLLRHDPRFSCHGRAVDVAGAHPDSLADQIALARLQGVGPAFAVPAEEVVARKAHLEAAGLQVDTYAHWRGAAGAVRAARRTLDRRHLPPDLQATFVTAETSAATMAGLDALTQRCQVLLPMGPFLRGQARPAVAVYASTPQGAVVGTAATIAQFHPQAPEGDMAWWGMLATDESRRGQGLARVLGAIALVEMERRHGYRRFFTGIREGNAASAALCSELGLEPTGALDMIAIDPDVFGAGRLTK
jgi:GNAT superfamily N-acetyltransferase